MALRSYALEPGSLFGLFFSDGCKFCNNKYPTAVKSTLGAWRVFQLSNHRHAISHGTPFAGRSGTGSGDGPLGSSLRLIYNFQNQRMIRERDAKNLGVGKRGLSRDSLNGVVEIDFRIDLPEIDRHEVGAAVVRYPFVPNH